MRQQGSTEGPVRRPERGGSEWEPIKILLQRENSAYVPNSQPHMTTRVYQGSVVTANLPTLGENPKRSQSERETQREKDLAAQHWTRRTVRKHLADRLQGPGGLSADTGRTVREAAMDRTKTTPEPPILHPQ
jgi:hypothetical protein